MAKKFAELEAKMSPQAREQSDALYRKHLKEMPLQELRNARNLTQAQLSKSMGMKQASISKIERGTDMYISTLKHFVNAVSGDLEIRVRFPDGEVEINQFKELSTGT